MEVFEDFKTQPEIHLIHKTHGDRGTVSTGLSSPNILKTSSITNQRLREWLNLMNNYPKKIKEVVIEGYSFGKVQFEILLKILQQLEPTTICFDNCSLTDSQVTSILENCPKVVYFSAKFNKIQNFEFPKNSQPDVPESLNGPILGHLKAIDLSWNLLTCFNLPRSNRLEYLDLSHSSLAAEGLKLILDKRINPMTIKTLLLKTATRVDSKAVLGPLTELIRRAHQLEYLHINLSVFEGLRQAISPKGPQKALNQAEERQIKEALIEALVENCSLIDVNFTHSEEINRDLFDSTRNLLFASCEFDRVFEAKVDLILKANLFIKKILTNGDDCGESGVEEEDGGVRGQDWVSLLSPRTREQLNNKEIADLIRIKLLKLNLSEHEASLYLRNQSGSFNLSNDGFSLKKFFKIKSHTKDSVGTQSLHHGAHESGRNDQYSEKSGVEVEIHKMEPKTTNRVKIQPLIARRRSSGMMTVDSTHTQLSIAINQNNILQQRVDELEDKIARMAPNAPQNPPFVRLSNLNTGSSLSRLLEGARGFKTPYKSNALSSANSFQKGFLSPQNLSFFKRKRQKGDPNPIYLSPKLEFKKRKKRVGRSPITSKKKKKRKGKAKARLNFSFKKNSPGGRSGSGGKDGGRSRESRRSRGSRKSSKKVSNEPEVLFIGGRRMTSPTLCEHHLRYTASSRAKIKQPVCSPRVEKFTSRLKTVSGYKQSFKKTQRRKSSKTKNKRRSAQTDDKTSLNVEYRLQEIEDKVSNLVEQSNKLVKKSKSADFAPRILSNCGQSRGQSEVSFHQRKGSESSLIAKYKIVSDLGSSSRSELTLSQFTPAIVNPFTAAKSPSGYPLTTIFTQKRITFGQKIGMDPDQLQEYLDYDRLNLRRRLEERLKYLHCDPQR